MLKILCSGNEEHFDYFRKHAATIVQQRRRTEIAVGLHTEEEGSGKGFYFNHFGHILGSHYMQVTNPEHVTGKFNPHFETLLLLFADEAVFAKDPRHRNAIYGLITEPRLTIEPKFMPIYSARSYINLGLASNADHFLPVGPNARRFFIPTVSPEKAGDLGYFNRIEAQLKNGGYEALLYHLLHEVDLRDFDVRKVPKTVGLADQAQFSRKGVDGLVEAVCNEARVPCAFWEHPDCSQTNIDATVQQSLDYMLAHSDDRELRKPLTVKRRLCKYWGCKSGDAARIWNGSDHHSCLQWPPLAVLRANFEERHGPQDWDRSDVTEWRADQRSSIEDTGEIDEASLDLDARVAALTLARRDKERQ